MASEADTHSAHYALEDARASVRRARLDLQDMHHQVSGASWALSDVERQVRAGETEDSSEAMNRVARRSQEAADFGIAVATQLRNAGQYIATAQDHAGRINTAGLSAPEAADVADLRARIEAYGQAVDLAGPMATAASEHLYSATDLAARAGAGDLDTADPPAGREVSSIAAVAGDLSRAQEADVLLERTVALADDVGERILANRQMEMSMTQEAQPAHNDHFSREARDGHHDVHTSLQEAGQRAAEDARVRMVEQSRRDPAPTGDPAAPQVQGPRR
ncbi:MAG: hypothetical protein L0H31_03090 [Nocardioidaceae bacterium]|nr:hypothetical protein [Nocardioidaceae bacterium]